MLVLQGGNPFGRGPPPGRSMDYQETYIKLGLAVATLIVFYFLVARNDEKDNNDD